MRARGRRSTGAASIGGVSAPDPEQLHAAADRGMLAAFWAAEDAERPAVISEAGNRTRAEANANANRLVRALRARGVAGRRRARVDVREPARVLRDGRRGPPRRAAAHDRQLAPHRRRGGLHRRRLRGDRVRRRRALRPRRPRAPPISRPGCAPPIAVGGTIDGFDDWDDVLAPESGDDIDDPVVRRHDALHVGHDRAGPKGVRRPPDPRSALDVAMLTQYRGHRHVHLCTGPLYHAAPLSFSLTAPAAMGVPDRDDGRLVGGTHARADRGTPRHAHAHGADDVPPPARAARRGEGALRHLLARLRHPRRGAVPGRREATADGVARPDRVGVLRRDRGRGHARRSRRMAAQAGDRRPGQPARSRPHPRRRGEPRRVGRDRHRLPAGARRRPLRVLQGARRRPKARTATRISPSATSATSTPTATSSSPIAARTSSSAGA